MARRRPHDPRQALGAARTGRHSEPNLGQPQPAGLGRHADVAAQRQLEPAAEGVPLDRGDGRHRQARQAVGRARLEGMSLTTVRSALRLELPDVRAGGERPIALAGDHDHPDIARRRGLEDIERTTELDEELARDEVERRVGDREVGDGAQLEPDETGHGALAKSAARPIGPVA